MRLYIALFAFFFSVLGNTEPGFASNSKRLKTAQPESLTEATTASSQNQSDSANSGWNLVPRQVTAMGTKNATYTTILKNYLGRNGLPDATPQIMQMFKVDLDGDDVDEVVIIAQNIIERETAGVTWEVNKPLSRSIEIPRNAKKGDYSLALVRKIVDGKVREIPLSQFIAQNNSNPNDAGWTLPLLHKAYQIADVDGDGIMEIIVGEHSNEGFSYQAYTIKGDKAVKIFMTGAGWTPSADSAPLPAEEARKILQTWLNGHPIQPHPVLARDHREYAYGGDAYYLFSLDDIQRYWLNFLVHKKTGELLYMMISDGEHVSIEIEPLDAWYAKHF